MKKLFDKVEVKNQNTLSKAEKKKFNPAIGNILDMKTDYKVLTLSTKLKLVKDETRFLLFEYLGRVYPTVSTFDKANFKTVWLDAGALGPISRGADVMAPGILKYLEKCPEFDRDEILGVEIEGQGVYAVGQVLVGYKEMVQTKEGPVVEILHCKGDNVDLGRI